MRLGKKSDLLNILVKDTQNDPPDFVDVKLLDGAAVVHFLHTVNVLTFDQYAEQVFLPYVMKQLENSRRVEFRPVRRISKGGLHFYWAV